MKYIIQNNANLEGIDAIRLIEKVIMQGKLSDNGNAYCYAMRFVIQDKNYIVCADKTRYGYKFRIREENNNV